MLLHSIVFLIFILILIFILVLIAFEPEE